MATPFFLHTPTLLKTGNCFSGSVLADNTLYEKYFHC